MHTFPPLNHQFDVEHPPFHDQVASLKRILQKPPHSLEVTAATKVLLLASAPQLVSAKGNGEIETSGKDGLIGISWKISGPIPAIAWCNAILLPTNYWVIVASWTLPVRIERR